MGSGNALSYKLMCRFVLKIYSGLASWVVIGLSFFARFSFFFSHVVYTCVYLSFVRVLARFSWFFGNKRLAYPKKGEGLISFVRDSEALGAFLYFHILACSDRRRLRPKGG